MKALIIHGWMEHPDFAWIPWLKKELESRGYDVDVPYLPNPDFPDRETWVGNVREYIRDPHTLIVAHSLGCPTVLLALEGYLGEAVDHVMLVSGFARPFTLPLQPWFLGAKFNFSRIKSKAKRWTLLHAENDLVVPYTEGAWLASQMDVVLTTIQGGHVTQEEGVTDFPELLLHL